MPEGIEISAEDGSVRVWGGGGQVVVGITYLDDYEHDEAWRFAAESALERVQDGVIHMTTDPWPTHGTGEVAMPFAAVRESTLVWGYGSARQPVVSLPGVPLGALSGEPGRDGAA